MSQISIANVINITVAQPPTGLAAYEVNNLAYFTKETPINYDVEDFASYLDPQAVAEDWGTNSEVYAAALKVFNQTPNILTGNGSFIVVLMESGDTLTSRLATIQEKVFFGGACYGGYEPNDAELLAAAEAFQAAKILLFVSQHLTAALDGGGIFNDIQAANFTRARCLLYTIGATEARLFAAAYASLGMATNFSGSLTTATQNLKELVGVLPDPGITQTILDQCQEIGADVYVNMAGLSVLISTGGNDYFDNQFNQIWLIFALTVAGFNALRETNTKVPQTEQGVSVLTNAYLGVFQQAVRNGYVAPGAWNSPQLFGDPESLRENILQQGFYIYSAPINQQPQVDRVARQAPLIQCAIKLAGAIQSSNVIVYLNP